MLRFQIYFQNCKIRIQIYPFFNLSVPIPPGRYPATTLENTLENGRMLQKSNSGTANSSRTIGWALSGPTTGFSPAREASGQTEPRVFSPRLHSAIAPVALFQWAKTDLWDLVAYHALEPKLFGWRFSLFWAVCFYLKRFFMFLQDRDSMPSVSPDSGNQSQRTKVKVEWFSTMIQDVWMRIASVSPCGRSVFGFMEEGVSDQLMWDDLNGSIWSGFSDGLIGMAVGS